MTTILTLAMEAEAQEWFDKQRKLYFPPALNRIPAHLTLFHRLPRDGTTAYVLRQAAGAREPFMLRVDGLGWMGRGVMYTLSSPELTELHKQLAERFLTFLTPQDKQPLRPHVVVQNKVEPHEAKALLAHLQLEFSAREVLAEGLDWWEYLDGRWRFLERFGFRGSSAGGPDRSGAGMMVREGVEAL